MDTGTDHTQTLGRPSKLTLVEIVRELTPEDLTRLGKGIGSKPTALKRITDAHHEVARLMAQGEANYAIAEATGYSQSRLSILKNDPAFQELIAHYRSKVDEFRDGIFIDTTRRLKAFADDAVELAHEKMLELGTENSFDDLRENAKLGLDRAGYGPQSKSTSTNFNISYADRISAGRQRAVIQHAAVPAARAAREVNLPLIGTARHGTEAPDE